MSDDITLKLSKKPLSSEMPFGEFGDALRAGQQAQSLTNLLRSVQHPVVIAVDGKWGTGKTTFLKMWENEVAVHANSFSMIHFDAFADDYIDDPFASLASCIVEYANENLPDDRPNSELRAKAASVIKQLSGGALRVATAFGLGMLPSSLGNATGEAAKAAINEFSNVAQNELEKILEEQGDRRKAAADFCTQLSILRVSLNELHARKDAMPLVVVIDELDRCRPDYALRLLERVKHFLNVPKVHFVLGLNLSQMYASVKASYGQDVDAEAYLRKFINLTIHLREVASNRSRDELEGAINQLFAEFAIRDKNNDWRNCLADCAVALSATLRDLERIASNLALISMGYKPSFELAEDLLPVLLSMKVVRPQMYEKARLGTLAFSDIENMFGFLKVAKLENGARLSRVQVSWIRATYRENKEGFAAVVEDMFDRQVNVMFNKDLLKIAVNVIEDFNLKLPTQN